MTQPVRIGVIGCGSVSEKYLRLADHMRLRGRAETVAACDINEARRDWVRAEHGVERITTRYQDLLEMPDVDLVLVLTSMQEHGEITRAALKAGKHVLVEKPMGVSVEECEQLRQVVAQSGRVLQVGYNKRFDPGLVFAHRFIQNEIGERMALKAWYCDSTYRYTMTDNLQILQIASPQALRPAGNPKADKRRYFMLTHGSHLVDTARFLCGEIASVHGRLVEKFGAYCWFVAVEFADGGIGHLDLTVAVRGDWSEGFTVYGEKGSVNGKMFIPWFHKTSEVECFSVADGQYHRPLGEDAHSYKLQIEGFAETILNGAPQRGADVDDGAAGVRVLVAIARSVEQGRPVRLDEVTGAV